MRISEIYARQISAVSDLLHARVDDLDARLHDRPGPALNPAGFIVWHILRVWDHEMKDARSRTGQDDIWHGHEFSAETGYEPVVTHTDEGIAYADGFRYTDAEVDAVPYRADWLNRYHRLLRNETLAWLADVDDSDIVQTAVFAGRVEPTSVAQIIEHIIEHSAYHVGELQMTRGMLGIPDPFTPPRSATN